MLRSKPLGLLIVAAAVAGACAHSDAPPKKKRHRRVPAAQDANTPAKESSDDGDAPVAKPKQLGPDTWQVEADGTTLEEAAHRAVHAAVVLCGERKQVPLPETDSNRRVAGGVRVTFTFHCVQIEADPPPMPMMDLDPMPLGPD